MSADVGIGCRPSCPCHPTTPDQAARKVAEFIGVDPGQVEALLAMLRLHGWTLTKES